MAALTALRRSFSRWSSPKDPSLEAALSRNKRWTINNQIKRFLLSRPPPHEAPVSLLQRHFKSISIRRSALSWLHKYPSCFDVFNTEGDGAGYDPHFTFSKRMAERVFAEADAVDASQDAMVSRLGKILMLSRDRRLAISKISAIRSAFGFPDDYLLRVLTKCPDVFRVVPSPCRRHGVSDIRLLKWDPILAFSAVEAAASDGAPKFRFMLPNTWVKTRSKFDEFNDGIPYVSPYCEDWMAVDSLSSEFAEKRAVGVVHELLSLTLWKKLSILKLEHFWQEFGLPENLGRLLMKHQGIFYVSNRCNVYTVVLREAYSGSELVEKDPVVAAKEQLGELMQEGLHEYNQRRRLLNLEKRRKRGELTVKQEEEEEDKEEAARATLVEKREERKRFYKVLFDG